MSANETPLRDRLPKTEKFSYALGAVPFGFAYMALAQLIYPVFNLTLGMSATLIGVVLAIGRLWDAVTDPVMGTFSDNARTRWGRRRPFIFLGEKRQKKASEKRVRPKHVNIFAKNDPIAR